MKLISLNTWEGQIYEPLKNFIKYHAKDVDIFCFPTQDAQKII